MNGVERVIKSEVNIGEMMGVQEKFEAVAFERAGTNRTETETKRKIALVSEVIEVADELPQWWKYWKHNQKPIDDGLLLEELADVLHMIFSKGIDFWVDNEQGLIIVYKSKTEQLNALIKWSGSCDNSHNWIMLFGTFRGLLKHLEIDWSVMTLAYYIKNKKNHERQQNGY